jgi:hypothetical protein
MGVNESVFMSCLSVEFKVGVPEAVVADLGMGIAGHDPRPAVGAVVLAYWCSSQILRITVAVRVMELLDIGITSSAGFHVR